MLVVTVAGPVVAGAADVAAEIVARQTAAGGWPKGKAGPATIDNGVTVREMRMLARAIAAGATGHLASFHRGLDWLLAAQYRNGGWPQVFPLAGGYHDRITFNDDAMVNVLTLLRDVSRGGRDLAFVGPDRRRACGEAVRRGVACFLACQVATGGMMTVWGQQHDERNLGPRPGRAFEPAALTASESVPIVRFLMGEESSPDVVAAVEAACAWFLAHRLPDGRWARFYEVGTNRPVFCGRDGVVRYRLEEIEPERRTGYAWFTSRPARLLSRDLPAWRRRAPPVGSTSCTNVQLVRPPWGGPRTTNRGGRTILETGCRMNAT